MIKQLQNQEPVIHFGFGLTHKSVPSGAPVKVWLATLYNTNTYTFSLSAGGSITRISDYEYDIVFQAPGLYEFTMIVSVKKSKISLQSNVITVNVI